MASNQKRPKARPAPPMLTVDDSTLPHTSSTASATPTPTPNSTTQRVPPSSPTVPAQMSFPTSSAELDALLKETVRESQSFFNNRPALRGLLYTSSPSSPSASSPPSSPLSAPSSPRLKVQTARQRRGRQHKAQYELVKRWLAEGDVERVSGKGWELLGEEKLSKWLKAATLVVMAGADNGKMKYASHTRISHA